MAKGQHLTPHQRGIVRRYYNSLDAVTLQKLQELVSDLYLATDAKAARLWEQAERHLARAGADAVRTARILGARDVKALAELVGELAAPAAARPAAKPRPRATDDF